MGGGARWLTLVSPDRPDGPVLLLEPNAGYPAMAELRAALMRDGIAATMLEVDDLQAEVARLTALGVSFTLLPTDMGTASFAIFDDTCGNQINIFQPKS